MSLTSPLNSGGSRSISRRRMLRKLPVTLFSLAHFWAVSGASQTGRLPVFRPQSATNGALKEDEIGSRSSLLTRNFPSSILSDDSAKRGHLDLSLQQSLIIRGGDASFESSLDSSTYRGPDPPGSSWDTNSNNNAYAVPPNTHEAADADLAWHERTDQWRNQQRHQAESTQFSSRDEKGRLKLLTSVSRGSRALIFFILLWRNVHFFEVADQAGGPYRLFRVIPIMAMFLGNLSGFVVCLTTAPSHGTKKRLKAILNLDKLLEMIMMFHFFFRLTIFPNPYIAREVNISGLLHSMFFIMQCQAFTKLSWDESHAPSVQSYAEQRYRPADDDDDSDDDATTHAQQYQQQQQQPYGTRPAFDRASPDASWQEPPQNRY